MKKQIDGDKRYRAVDSPITREDYFHDYLKSLKEERRKQKDKDKEYRDRKERKDRDNKHRDKDRRDKGKDSKSNKDDHDKRADSKDSDRIERSKDERTSHNDSDKDDDIISVRQFDPFLAVSPYSFCMAFCAILMFISILHLHLI